MIKTKENQNGCASSNNVKEKEYTLKASSIQSFCLNLHFESTATAMTVGLQLLTIYVKTSFCKVMISRVLWIPYKISFTKRVIKKYILFHIFLVLFYFFFLEFFWFLFFYCVVCSYFILFFNSFVSFCCFVWFLFLYY